MTENPRIEPWRVGAKPVHWSQVLYNPFIKGLHPDLIHSKDKTATKLFYSRTVGMSKLDDQIKLEVTYDEEYLVEYLIRKVIEPLNPEASSNGFNNLQIALGKAYKLHKERLEDENI